MTSLNLRAARGTALFAVVMAALVFIPAGTLRYWQGWLFIAVFQVLSVAIGVYLALNDPELLERRLKGGPVAETETTQRIIMTLAMLGFIALLVLPPLDHRFRWSSVPWPAVLAGDTLIVLGYLIMFVVLKANRFGASTIQVTEGQHVVSTGPYAVVRHPMYAGAIVLLAGTPLALGSWWGLIIAALCVPVLMWRLLDEERFLKQNLPGYTDYTQSVRFRLVPYVW
jgi:protein-S-isoprenylcysteine O-methyltransferase Ste14